MKIGLKKLKSHKEVTVKALLDSGATGLFIDTTFAKEKGFKIEKLKNHLCHDLAKQLSYYLIFLFFIIRIELGKVLHDCHRVTEWSHHTHTGCHMSQSHHVTKKSADRHKDYRRQDT